MKTTYPYNREMPVSAKFYSRLTLRIRTILSDLGYNADSDEMEEVMYLVNLHLGMNPALRKDSSLGFVSRVIFLTLQAEIDAAVARSRRCREAAMRRRESREVSHPVDITPAEPISTLSSKPQTDSFLDKYTGVKPADHQPTGRHTQQPEKDSFKRLKFRPVVNLRKRKKFRKK